tara:strand:- start:300 stop:437 length:138 start_codon:yes stop_codon:yes gene_type:complete
LQVVVVVHIIMVVALEAAVQADIVLVLLEKILVEEDLQKVYYQYQ